MKKTMIALAVAAALPVAAQADVTLSGSVAAEFTLGSNLTADTDAAFAAASSEVLANGMTATASLDVLGAGGSNVANGKAGLSGDFGAFTVGNGAKTLADVANSGSTAATTDDEDADLDGISYTGSFAGLSVNAAAGNFDEDDTTGTTLVDYSTYGASYDFNGLTVTGQSTTEGTAAASNKLTASYAFGDLTVSASKSTGADVVMKGAYAATLGDLTVSASADSSDDWDVSMTYALGDISITAIDDETAGGADMSASYSADNLTVTVDSDSDVDVSYSMGNAVVAMSRDTDADATTVKYTLSF